MNSVIPFNKPYMSGKETAYIAESVAKGKISGDGFFSKKCRSFFTEKLSYPSAFLTTSCTDALEMSAILAEIGPGDEVIMPSYTFVSTANAFVLRGATIRFADSQANHPNVDAASIASLITERTKVIVPVHYAGVACQMDEIVKLAEDNDLLVVEDAAQSIDAYYKKVPLGTIGHFGAFSFHETKNIICGEGGLLTVNDPRFQQRAEIIREKGTNRTAFFRGDVDKYGWVDIGSSFLPSDILAAYLYAQLESLEDIQRRRLTIWKRYRDGLQELGARGCFALPVIPDFATNNAHMFYLTLPSIEERSAFISYLRKRNITAVFHYQSLHASRYFADKHDGRELKNADRFTECLVRLPLYYELTSSQQDFIIATIHEFFGEARS